MPPRYAYWTILIDGKATAFRAKEQDELLPTLAQLRRKNDDVTLRYFSRGKLWDSPEQAQWAGSNEQAFGERRDQDWRPGGSHKDPRARFDKKPKRSRDGDDRPRAERRAEKFGPPRPDSPEQPGDAVPARAEAPPPVVDRPQYRNDRPQGERKSWSDRPRRDDRPQGDGDRERRPWSDKPRPEGKRPWTPRPPRPEGDRPWSDRPPRRDDRPQGERKPWSDRPRSDSRNRPEPAEGSRRDDGGGRVKRDDRPTRPPKPPGRR